MLPTVEQGFFKNEMMKIIISAVMLFVFTAFLHGMLHAADINFNDATVPLAINSATAGLQPDPVSISTSYDIVISVFDSTKKITVALDSNMGAGLTLTINVSAPSTSGSSTGTQTLTTSSVDVVTGISHPLLWGWNENNININYSLTATVAAGVISGARTVTMTITNN